MEAGRRLAGQVALVTGAGHGIGRASALRLAAEGAAVAALDLRAETARETAAAIEGAGGRSLALTADVADAAQVEAAVGETAARLGPATLLHANAGVLLPGSAVELEHDDWERTFAVNVRGMLVAVRAVLPAMLERGRGAVVLTGSSSGLVGEPGLAAYDASKGAVVNLTRQLAADYAGRGVRVNCVCPGWIDTGFNDPVLAGMGEAELEAMVSGAVPMRRQGRAEEIAAAVAFLLSDDASYVCGAALSVDGGLTAV